VSFRIHRIREIGNGEGVESFGMTEEQYKIAKQYYEAKTGKQFELLKLYQMNEWLEKALTILTKKDEKWSG